MDISHGVDNELLASLVESTDINKSNNAQSVRRAWYQVAAQYSSAKGLSTVDLETVKGALQRRWNHMRSRAKQRTLAAAAEHVEVAAAADPNTTNTTVIMNPKMEHVVEVIQTAEGGVHDGATVVKQIQIPTGNPSGLDINQHPAVVPSHEDGLAQATVVTAALPTQPLVSVTSPPGMATHHKTMTAAEPRRKRNRATNGIGGILATPSFKKIEHDIGLHQNRELHLVRMKIARLEEEAAAQKLENERVYSAQKQRESEIQVDILLKKQEVENQKLEAELRVVTAEADKREAEARKAQADADLAELELEKARKTKK